jgi:hypothetical protein
VFDAAPAAIGTEWSTLVGAVIRVERDVLTRGASTGLWQRSTKTAFYLASTVSQPPAPPPLSAITRRSRTPRTIAATSPWPRTAPASASIPLSLPASAASPSTSSKPTTKDHSLRTAFAPLSVSSITSSAAFAFQSVERPCLEAHTENG